MRVFDEKILALLRAELGGEHIYFVGLGAFDFQFAFGNLSRIQNQHRVDFCLQGAEYTWEEGACAIPAWLLIDQVPVGVVLESPTTMRVSLRTGDWVRLHTEDGPHESQMFQWMVPNRDGIITEMY